ncbi:hypothetical protein NW762_014115 [Fusarium torreyae]|uniref:NmrA-like domain-containing protein n=1 Tax=Fusarium torreyae TaxID=1237075 RepID=A0A9W8RM79_9HYPO|nr:hypothetical protein NW762_014115 [Fusarium torreyae]
MVKIAVAGGAGNVGQEVLDALVARNKHEILLLSRKDAPKTPIAPGVKWLKTTYEDTDELVKMLEGVHTVLSFMSIPPGPGSAKPQLNLIDASIRAGVKRFAPSEWVGGDFKDFPWYDFKRETREYLANINKEKKVIEYTLFRFGLFTNYMTYPYKSSKHITVFETPFNFNNQRALVVDNGEAVIAITTIQDVAKVTALVVEYEGEWPLVSGAKSADMTLNEVIALGQKIRGKPFKVESLKSSDLSEGKVEASWLPLPEHPSIPDEAVAGIAAQMTKGVLLGWKNGALNIPDTWNRLLPDYKFTSPEQFLTEAWALIDNGAKEVFTQD